VSPVSAAVGKKVATIEAIDATPLGRHIVAARRSLNVPRRGSC